MPLLRVVLVLLLLLALGIGGAWLWSRQPEIAGIEPPPFSSFAADLVARGARLAAVGDCDTCHTVPGGPHYAGGRQIPTPFGTVYSTNITPDRDTGIGGWSEAAFARAVREGVSRRGRYLYPAFPYDHYAKLADDDVHALYAFVMTRSPVIQRTPRTRLAFPLNQRWLVALWNLLYLDRTPFRSDPGRSAEENRGAYLVEGLGHCGDCHTPRNLLGAEKSGEALAGGMAEGWHSPALDAASPAPVPWNADHLFAYLHQGWDTEHGAAAGPMQPVVEDLAQADPGDVRAIAAYIAALQGPPSAERQRRAEALLAQSARREPTAPAHPADDLGAAIFAGACASCHFGGPAMVPPRGIDLALSSAIAAPDPSDAVYVILDGIRPPEGRPGPWMPGFAGAFTDAQLGALLRYLRGQYDGQPAWPDLDSRIRDVRRSRERS